MDAGEGADNMVQASKAVGAGIISATSPLVVYSDTIARWDGSVFELSTRGEMMDADEGVVYMVQSADYIPGRYNSEGWRIPFESSTGTRIIPEHDGGIVIRGTFVKRMLPRQYTQLSPAALGIRGDE